ncbi:MAG: FtsW/RodA/SpoVE family cell cycle protein [Prevotellaceae bacterium]|jgi:cell division protein FtsW|nr:FtsW/RodA/SpoVE family cell cycle protein [Prevotellaceae bacterium]
MLKDFFKNRLKGDSKIWAVYFSLVIISIFVFFVASSRLIGSNDAVVSPVFFHIIHLILGFGMLWIFYNLSRENIRLVSFFLLAVSVVLLLYLLVAGKSHQGASRTFLGFFQPSEFAKLTLIVVAAYFIDKFQDTEFLKKYFRHFCWITLLTIGLIFPMNLSMAGLIAFPILVMMIVGSMPLRNILIWVSIPIAAALIILGISAIVPDKVYNEFGKNRSVSVKYNPETMRNERVVSYKKIEYDTIFRKNYETNNTDTILAKPPFLKKRLPYMTLSILQKFRWETWKNRFVNHREFNKIFKNWDKLVDYEKEDFIEENFQVVLSQCAIYEGKFLGPSASSSVWRNRLPDASSDFVFALIVGEFGWLLAFFVIFLYVILLYRSGVLIRKSKTVFSSVVIVGATLVIALQAALHISVNLSFFPVTGQTLPLISKGGSSIVVISAFFGLILGMSRIAEKEKIQKNDENYDENSEILENKPVEKEFKIGDKITQPSEIEVIDVY